MTLPFGPKEKRWRLERIQESWPQVIAEVRADLDKGTDPADARLI